MYKILIVQRFSLSNRHLESRSIGARFIPFINSLSKDGLITSLVKLESEITTFDISDSDVVLLCKHTTERGLQILEEANLLSKLTVYDLDDWIFDIPEYSMTTLNIAETQNAINMLKNARIVTVSNEALRNKLSDLNIKSFVLGTGFDHKLIEVNPMKYEESSKPSVVYSNTDGVKLIKRRKDFFAALSDFLLSNKEVDLHFWGDRFDGLNLLPNVVYHKFAPNHIYKRELSTAGYWFGLVPLGGDEDASEFFFNACKSPVKYIDYASLCIPGIYSDSPVYSSVVTNGKTGLLVANTYEQWLSNMNLMLNNLTLRTEIRGSAYTNAVENYGIDSVSNKFLRILDGAR